MHGARPSNSSNNCTTGAVPASVGSGAGRHRKDLGRMETTTRETAERPGAAGLSRNRLGLSGTPCWTFSITPDLVWAFPRCGLSSRTFRAELIELQVAYRRDYRDTHRISQERLTWSRPGRVWAVDHSEAPVRSTAFIRRSSPCVTWPAALSWPGCLSRTWKPPARLSSWPRSSPNTDRRCSSRATTARPSAANWCRTCSPNTTSSGCRRLCGHRDTMGAAKRGSAA